jgi:hypothetical protein
MDIGWDTDVVNQYELNFSQASGLNAVLAVGKLEMFPLSMYPKL